MNDLKRHAFFFHYNKPASQAAGRPQISVHYRGQCYVVDEVACYVTTKSRVRRTQPHFVMAGRTQGICFDDNRAVIV